jgi:uncharacterized protein YebE (UPF0316 family)
MEDIFSMSNLFSFVILPLLIFLSRVIDQSVGTLRIIFASKGMKQLAPVLAFFESFIWLLAISQIMKHLDNIVCYITYAGGFAMGNYIGILIEEKLSIGNVVMRIIPKLDSSQLISHLRSLNYGITVVDVEGSLGPTKMIFTTIRRKETNLLVDIIKTYNPYAFYTIDEVKYVSDLTIDKKSKSIFSIFNPFHKTRK